MMRPLGAASDPSPALLRLSVRPALGRIDIGILKRQGPQRDELLFLPMSLPMALPTQPRRRAVPERAATPADVMEAIR